MSNSLALLEQLACHGTAFPCEIQQDAVVGFDPTVQGALLSRNIPALVEALGGRARMFCCIWAPEDDESVPAEQPAFPDDEPMPQEKLVA